MTRGGLASFMIVAAVILAAGMLGLRNGGRLHAKMPGAAQSRAPEGQRVRVEVLNATRVRGLARRATQVLRDDGFDVVEVGTSPDLRGGTLVLDRSGHPDWARRVSAALSGAPVETRPDSSRYVDVTVLLGASWRPAPKPFYP